MENNDVLFDDWQVRCERILERRRAAYAVCISAIGVLLVSSCIGMFLEPALFLPFVICVAVFAVVVLEYLKVKNNHLVIRNNLIEITNRFNKTTTYKVNIRELTLIIKHSINYRSGGIIMLFYDSKDNLICKYEDMFNRTALFGCEKTKWEKTIEGFNIKVVDPTGIIKN